MSSVGRIGAGKRTPQDSLASPRPLSFQSLLSLLAQPRVAGLVAFVVYFMRATLNLRGMGATPQAYFNYLAYAFLHGHLFLNPAPRLLHDLVLYGDKVYLYWPPFPAMLIMPLVAIFGIGVSDVVYTVIFGAITIALLARVLSLLDRCGIAPLTVERRAILVAAVAFGSVVFILSPAGSVWFTAQIIGWGCVLVATAVALGGRRQSAYFWVGVALACAMATRLGLVFNGIWLAYYLLRRDWQRPLRWRLAAVTWALLPVVATAGLLAWYNAARFGSPLEMGITWHKMGTQFRDDFARYGAFNLHYLPTNLYYQFVALPTLLPHRATFIPSEWMGSGIFWMTPVFLGAPYAIWRERRNPLVWSLLLSCLLVYVPIGLVMGTGFITVGPRYLLDLMVPLLVLVALGIKRWRLDILILLLAMSCGIYMLGSWAWWLIDLFPTIPN